MTCNNNRDPHQESSGISRLTATELVAAYRDFSLHPADVVRTLLNRIEALESGTDALHAVIEVDASGLDLLEVQSEAHGSLWGVPIIVKDNIEVEGWISGAGSDLFHDPVTSDADCIATLRAATAVFIANANLTEWAAAGSTTLPEGFSHRGGQTLNPWNREHSTGGSSSGSAVAVAAGLAPLALGSETVGSMTYPASHCGVYAMKATRGAVSNRGIVPYSSVQDVPAVFARSIDDIELVMSHLLKRPLLTSSPSRVRLLDDADLDDPSQTSAGLRDDYRAFLTATADQFPRGLIPRTSAEFPDRLWTALLGELHHDLDAYLEQRGDLSIGTLEELSEQWYGDDDDEYPFDNFRDALTVTSAQARAARRSAESEAREILETLLGDADAAAAIAVSTAPRLDGDDNPTTYISFLDALTSTAGWPSAIMPFTTDGGLPVGLIVMARPNREDAIISAVRQLESTGIPSGFVPPSWTGW